MDGEGLQVAFHVSQSEGWTAIIEYSPSLDWQTFYHTQLDSFIQKVRKRSTDLQWAVRESSFDQKPMWWIEGTDAGGHRHVSHGIAKAMLDFDPHDLLSDRIEAIDSLPSNLDHDLDTAGFPRLEPTGELWQGQGPRPDSGPERD